MEYHFFDRKAETLPRPELEARQNQLLKSVVKRTAASNAWFAEHFHAAGIDPNTFSGLDALSSLPFMSKKDFRNGYPLAMSCVDKRSVAEMHMSSGSTGTPVVMPYTKHDLELWAKCMARCYVMAGAVPGDVCQITPGFGLFNGGFGCYHGAREAGLFVLPCGAGNTTRQIRLAQDFQTRVMVAVVSYTSRIIELLAEQKTSIPSLKIGIFGAEVFSEKMKERIRSGLGIDVFDIYGMTETGGIGIGMDCPAHKGIHIWEDQYIIEVIDPDTGKNVPDGEYGEIVITCLCREALPVVRFRTSDRGRILSRETCDCGRTSLRLDTITGRLDDMLIISGVNFFPSQVEQSLLKIPGVLPNYFMTIETCHGIQRLRVDVEAESGVTGYMVEKQLKEDLGFSPLGDVHAPGTLPRQEGKAKRVFFKDVE